VEKQVVKEPKESAEQQVVKEAKEPE